MTKMRCKVMLTTLSHSYNGISVKFIPVTGTSDENKAFYAATPGGAFEAIISTEAAKQLGAFELGKEYFVDFTPATEGK